MNESITITPCKDGVEIRFPFTALPQAEFDALTQAIKRNREAGKLDVQEIELTKDDTLIVKIVDIKGHVDEFIQLIKTELALADILPPMTSSPKEKVVKEFQKLQQTC